MNAELGFDFGFAISTDKVPFSFSQVTNYFCDLGKSLVGRVKGDLEGVRTTVFRLLK